VKKSPRDQLSDYADEIFAPQGRETVVEWAERNAYLSERVTEMAGHYRTSEHPYVREVLECWRDPKVKKVSMCWGSQTGKTTTIYIGLGWVIDRSPGPILWVWANEKQARAFANDRFIPFCEDSEVIARHLPKTLDGKIDRDRAAALHIEFDRCSLNMIGGGSRRNVRNYPASYLVVDELDIIEGAIIRDVMDRTKGRRSSTTFLSSTPLEENGIWAEYLMGDQRKYVMPCPHCSEFIPFEWRRGKTKDRPPKAAPIFYNVQFPEEARLEDGAFDWHLIKAATTYVCQLCGGKITDSQKLRMLKKGKWKATAKGEPGVRSYHLSSLYSPTITFAEMVTRWLRAQDSLNGLKQFITGWLAEPWREEILDVTEEATHALAGDYERGEMKGEFRLLGIDVQRSHFVWVVRAFGSSGESWLLDHGNAPTWNDLDRAYDDYECAGAVVDTGFGERTQECYEAIFRRRTKFWASKGWQTLSGPPVSIKAIDPFTGTNKAAKYKIRLLHVDVGVFGGEILKRRAGLVEGFHLYREPDRDYVKQLNAKYIIEKTLRTGLVKQEWRTKRHGQDHYFDCEVYIMALSQVLGLGTVRKRKAKKNERGEKGDSGGDDKARKRRPVRRSPQKRAGSIW